MASRDVEEVVTGIWCWERRPRGLRPGEFGGRTSYAVAIENDVLLLDPLVDGDDDPVLDVLDDLVRGGVRILVTMPYHARSSESLWRRYRSAKARIYGHPAVATRLDDVSGFKAVLGGSGVDGIARFHSIGRPPRSQQPIEIPPSAPSSSATQSSRPAVASCAFGRPRRTATAAGDGGTRTTCQPSSGWPTSTSSTSS